MNVNNHGIVTTIVQTAPIGVSAMINVGMTTRIEIPTVVVVIAPLMMMACHLGEKEKEKEMNESVIFCILPLGLHPVMRDRLWMKGETENILEPWIIMVMGMVVDHMDQHDPIIAMEVMDDILPNAEV